MCARAGDLAGSAARIYPDRPDTFAFVANGQAYVKSEAVLRIARELPDDFRLFGAISQHYCFLDLNLRRALEIMKLAKRLAGSSLRLARSRFAGPLRLFLSLLGGLLLRSGKRPAFSNLDRLVFVCRPLGNDKDTMPNLTGGALITVKAAN